MTTATGATWIYAKQDIGKDQRVITLAGYLVQKATGMHVADLETSEPTVDVVLVQVMRPQPNALPIPWVEHGLTVQVRVRGEYQLGRVIPAAHSIYFTPQGWVDHRSRPVPIPWETQAA